MLEIKRGNNDNGNGYFVFILSNMGGEVLFRGGGRGRSLSEHIRRIKNVLIRPKALLNVEQTAYLCHLKPYLSLTAYTLSYSHLVTVSVANRHNKE